MVLSVKYTVLYIISGEKCNPWGMVDAGEMAGLGEKEAKLLLFKEVTCRLKPVRRTEVSKHSSD